MRGKPEETRKRILRAATKLFYTQGIRAVGVDAIAAAAGVTKRTMYRHYASKDGLIAAYLEARNEPVLAVLVESVTTASGGIEEQVSAMFSALADRAKHASWHGCPFARAVSELRESDNDNITRIAANHKHWFENWLGRHLASENVEEPALLARQLLVLLDGCTTQLLIHRDPSYALAAAAAAKSLIKQRLK